MNLLGRWVGRLEMQKPTDGMVTLLRYIDDLGKNSGHLQAVCSLIPASLGRETPGQAPNQALVAQLDRASDYGSEGWGFEFLRAR